MASAESIWSGVITFFIGIFISIILFLSVAYPAEKIITEFENTPLFDGGRTVYDVPAPWDMGYTDSLRWMQLLYLVCSLPAILGTLIMFLSTIQTQSYDIFGTESAPQYQIPLETYNQPQDITPVFRKGGLF